MTDEEPSHFYKYRALGDAKERTRRIVTDAEIWFSKPADFNDPFDCAPGFSMAAPPETCRQYMAWLFREKGPPMRRQALRARLAAIQRNSQRRQNSTAFVADMRRRTWNMVNEAGVPSQRWWK